MNIADLRQMVILSHLTDGMLEKLVPLTDLFRFEENEMIFRQGGVADRFYLLKSGKILLELRISDSMAILMSAVKPGFSFGWSAMMEDSPYSTDAVCAEPCEVYSYRAEKLKALMEADHSMGFILSKRLLYVIKKRYDARTDQLVKTIRLNPEISRFL